MAVPDFQSIMLPLLQLSGDGDEHSLGSATDRLAEYFGLSEDERQELLPSGRQSRFSNRVGWASTYLRKSGLLKSTKRGYFAITQRGRDVLASQPAQIDMQYLRQFPEYLEFRGNEGQSDEESIDTVEQDERTPEERLEASYQDIRDQLAQEILEQLNNVTWYFFEKLVVDLLLAMGYGGSRRDAGQAFRRSGDDGIDGTIKEDKLGLDIVYIQAKRWSDSRSVGRPAVQGFAGSLEGVRARKGVFITTSTFTRDAYEYVDRIEKKIILIDGTRLVDLMIDHNVGVVPYETYILKRLDSDYFAEVE